MGPKRGRKPVVYHYISWEDEPESSCQEEYTIRKKVWCRFRLFRAQTPQFKQKSLKTMSPHVQTEFFLRATDFESLESFYTAFEREWNKIRRPAPTRPYFFSVVCKERGFIQHITQLRKLMHQQKDVTILTMTLVDSLKVKLFQIQKHREIWSAELLSVILPPETEVAGVGAELSPTERILFEDDRDFNESRDLVLHHAEELRDIVDYDPQRPRVSQQEQLYVWTGPSSLNMVPIGVHRDHYEQHRLLESLMCLQPHLELRGRSVPNKRQLTLALFDFFYPNLRCPEDVRQPQPPAVGSDKEEEEDSSEFPETDIDSSDSDN